MLINKEDLPLVAEVFMNEVHLEDVDIINDLYDSILEYEKQANKEKKELILSKYKHWFDHTVKHFKGEEDKMIELNFPPYYVHKSEHDECLNKMKKVIESFDSSEDISSLKEYFEKDLILWLGNHIQTMDTVTAMFFKTGLSPCHMK